jgi:1,2-phenylacetyl-CoA epoxidase catalytic subunit
MTFEAGERLAAALATVKEDLARVYTVWSLHGPTLEACTALTAMAQEEAGHARALLAVSGNQEAASPLACLHDVPEEWPELVGRAGTVELAVASVVHALRAGADPALAARTAKMSVEEGFHEDLFRGWFRVLEADVPAVAEPFRDAVRVAEGEVRDWLKVLDDLAVDAGVCAPGELTSLPGPPERAS